MAGDGMPQMPGAESSQPDNMGMETGEVEPGEAPEGMDPETGDTGMGGEPEATGADNELDGGEGLMDTINKLTPKDRETVEAYAKSLLATDETQDDEMGEQPEGMPEMPAEAPAPAPQQGQMPVMEIKKSTLTLLQKRMNEVFGQPDEDDRVERKQKKVNKGGFRGPFDSPRR